MKTNVQIVIEEQRALYGSMPKPLLQQLAEVHGLSIRDVAGIFEVSKGHAESILKHKCFPSLPVSLQISRYFETSIEELFGWRVDDAGGRRPLIVTLPGISPIRLKKRDGSTSSLMRVVAEHMHGGANG